MGSYTNYPEGHAGGAGEAWEAAAGDAFRTLCPDEVRDARQMAETTDFIGPEPCDHVDAGNSCTHREDHQRNAAWESHHPVVREVWERRGQKPVGA